MTRSNQNKLLKEIGLYPYFLTNIFITCSFILFQHELMTSEYVIDEIAKSLDLNPNRFELVAALLGCHILTVSDLSEFHQKLVPELKQVGGGEDGKDYKVGFDRVIR